MKTEFIVSDMTCNHCVQTITQAVKGVAPDAVVLTDLAAHRVTVESTADAAALRAAIAEEGYDVQPA
ncbi:heavy-metal-associated domain-containing protein [Castellaniella denitrificans]|jgi:copper chaperone|uniref:Heavy-metal-associated domain-containing protein n=1 Tax=Castellaniella denitrificans TaxID=56119 RepID=A0ABT4M8X0_9BURK|nr:heavy-metal-associated domain-containing protein [Castellaniella denitrificans]MCZ4330915.1 heavy-metal-associated domain-containing protein [Castellaniella denitrificans]